MSIHIRPLDGADEINEGFQLFLDAMVGLPFRPDDASALVEPGRFLGAFDGDTLVGTADSYRSWLTVPGGDRVAHSALTHVGVRPTHTRRGIVTALIGRQFELAAERGEIVSSLRASEAVIYERFGYAVASLATSARVTVARASLRPGAALGGSVRVGTDEERGTIVPDLYERAAWVGSIHRPPGWWRLRAQFAAADTGPRYLIIHSTDGVDDGYATYEPQDTAHWFTSDQRTITVSDFVAHSSSAYLGLLRYLLHLDLVDVIEFAALALDDPLASVVTDQRAVTFGSPHDETWLRLVDVPAALDARRYRDADPIVLEVSDRLLPRNDGRYEIGAKGATASTADPDLSVTAADLAAVYLGGTGWWQLARGGRVSEHTPGALDRADELFGTTRRPFSGTTF